MSILQSKQKNLRFLKRQNLEEEARIVGTWYSDLISQYGVDCVYYKLDTSVFGNYKDIVDHNTILEHAYGYNLNPDYSCSALMVTYPEVQTDIFQLNKYGIVPQAEVDFHFDAKQFACDLATQCGRLKEYKIHPREIVCEVPNCTDEVSTFTDQKTGEISSIYISSMYFPYSLGLGYREYFESDIVSGSISTTIDAYEYGKEYTLMCDTFNMSNIKISFPKDDDLYRSLEYQITSEKQPEAIARLKFRVEKVLLNKDQNTGIETYKSVLSGSIDGGILFYDVQTLGKYAELIHPEVGDIIAIDFPDENNREKYEITDCYNKSLQSDGISPLLHKYIWKCKARRHIGSQDDIQVEKSEADNRLQEKLDHQQVVDEQVSKTISKYDELDQEAYGGYDNDIEGYDKQSPKRINPKALAYEELQEDQCLDIMTFDVGSKLVTNGYDLIFINSSGDGYVIATQSTDIQSSVQFESNLRWIKATNDQIVFINIEGNCTAIVRDEASTLGKMQINLDDINEKTLAQGEASSQSGNFIRFNGSKTFIFATDDNLYAKMSSNGKIYQLV